MVASQLRNESDLLVPQRPSSTSAQESGLGAPTQLPGRPTAGRHASPASLLHLQRLAGNGAVANLVGGRGASRGATLPDHTERSWAVQRCGSIPASRCGCHGPDVSLQAEEGGSPTVQRVDYTNTHTCGVSQSARIFSSWAVAVAKLTENIPAVTASWATGLYTPNLKDKLKRHFNVDKTDKAEQKRVLSKLARGYPQILLRMGPGLAKVRCGGTQCEHDDYAYASSGSGNSTIWLCNEEFTDKPILDLAATWIHELSHVLFDTDDDGYYTYSGATTLNTNKALNEADCWGNFMVDYT